MPTAVVATAYTGVEGIGLLEVDGRQPAEGQVTLAVRAAALNPYDLKQARGLMGADPEKLPLRLGGEASGVVTAVGPNPVALDGTTLAVGDEVFGHRLPGAQADELTVKAGQLLRKPASVGFDEAGALLGVGTTAAHLVAAARVEPGDLVLIHGVAGGVGRMAAELALLRGAHVIGTAAEGRHAALRDLGVEPVVYGAGLADRVREHGIPVAAFDTVGTDEALEVSLALVADRSRIVTIANAAATTEAGGQALGGGPGADPGSALRGAARLELAQLLADGSISVPIVARFPISEARAAYTLLADGHAGGKIVLTG
jgi:NADPH:quinone reductase